MKYDRLLPSEVASGHLRDDIAREDDGKHGECLYTGKTPSEGQRAKIQINFKRRLRVDSDHPSNWCLMSGPVVKAHGNRVLARVSHSSDNCPLKFLGDWLVVLEYGGDAWRFPWLLRAMMRGEGAEEVLNAVVGDHNRASA